MQSLEEPQRKTHTTNGRRIHGIQRKVPQETKGPEEVRTGVPTTRRTATGQTEHTGDRVQPSGGVHIGDCFSEYTEAVWQAITFPPAEDTVSVTPQRRTMEDIRTAAAAIASEYGYMPMSDHGVWETHPAHFGMVQIDIDARPAVRQLSFTNEAHRNSFKTSAQTDPGVSTVIVFDKRDSPRPFRIQLQYREQVERAAVDIRIRDEFASVLRGCAGNDVRMAVDISTFTGDVSQSRGFVAVDGSYPHMGVGTRIVLRDASSLRKHQQIIAEAVCPYPDSPTHRAAIEDLGMMPFPDCTPEAMGKLHFTRSGQIDVPCGGGKTLAGIACSARLSGYTTVVVCNNQQVCEHWSNQFKRWTTIQKDRICVLADKKRSEYETATVWITTYATIAQLGKASADILTRADTREEASTNLVLSDNKRKFMALIRSGRIFTILDESQNAPAKLALHAVRQLYGPKLAMTATRCREDDGMEKISAHVGNVRLVCMWSMMERQAMIATAYCFNVPIRADPHIEPHNNPECIAAAASIAAWLADKGEKCLLFCSLLKQVDLLYQTLAAMKGVPLIGAVQGEAKVSEREITFDMFRRYMGGCVLLVSGVGDVGLDAPECTAIVQIPTDGSQRQHAQRLGRALRYSGGRPSYMFTVYDERKEESVRHRQTYITAQLYDTKTITFYPIHRELTRDIREQVAHGVTQPRHQTVARR